MEAPAAAADAASRGPCSRPPEQPTPAQQTTNNPFPLPTELLLHALSFIQGTHPLRSWRNVAEDLFSLRAASRALRTAVTDAALSRFETALLAAERDRRAGLVPLGAGPACAAAAPAVGSVITRKRKRGSPGFYGTHHHHRPVKALMRLAAVPPPSAPPPAEQRRQLFLAAAPITVVVVGGDGDREEEEEKQVVLCPRGEYDRATDDFLRTPGKLEALPDRDLLALFNRYGAGAAADVRLPPPPTRRLLPSMAAAAPALRAPERARLISGIRTRLCPWGYVGLSSRAQRILAAAGRERMPKSEGKARFGLTEAQMEGPNGIPYLQEGVTKLFPVWRLQAAAMRRHGSPAGLEAFLGSKREAAAARRGKLPLIDVDEVDDMGWEGVEAAATAGAEHYDEVEEDW